MIIKRRMSYGMMGAGVLALFALGCGASQPTPELMTARNAYATARNGEAAQLNPKGVHDAYKALQAAEAVHEDDAGSSEEKHFAYIATRKSELAISQAGYTLAQRETQRADQTYQVALEQRAAETTEVAQELDTTRQEADEARAKLESMQALREESGRLVIDLSGVLFETGKADLSPMAQAQLDTVARALNAYPNRAIFVEGHTDAQGNDEMNRELSQQRADSVRDYLETLGVPAAQIRAVGKGEAEPVASNDTAAGREKNRRVAIVVPLEGTSIEPGEKVKTGGRDEEETPSKKSTPKKKSPSPTPMPQQP